MSLKGLTDKLKTRIQTHVSGNRNRYVDEKYNLDISFITERVLAMSLPGSGLKTAWRNPIDTVAEFLRERFCSDYLIVNLSGIQYDYSKFDSQVTDFFFPDHNAPPLTLLFSVVLTIHQWLAADDNHVVVVHCKGGKGRTGSVIASYLVFAGICPRAIDACRCFAERRSSTKSGVSRPGQLRYVHYFESVLYDRTVPSMRPRVLKSIILSPPPRRHGVDVALSPVVHIDGIGVDHLDPRRRTKRRLFDSSPDPGKKPPSVGVDDPFVLWNPDNIVVSDDLILSVCHWIGPKDLRRVFRVVLHTAFIPSSNVYAFPFASLDGVNVRDFEFGEDLLLQLLFDPIDPESERILPEEDSASVYVKSFARWRDMHGSNESERAEDGCGSIEASIQKELEETGSCEPEPSMGLFDPVAAAIVERSRKNIDPLAEARRWKPFTAQLSEVGDINVDCSSHSSTDDEGMSTPPESEAEVPVRRWKERYRLLKQRDDISLGSFAKVIIGEEGDFNEIS